MVEIFTSFGTPPVSSDFLHRRYRGFVNSCLQFLRNIAGKRYGTDTELLGTSSIAFMISYSENCMSPMTEVELRPKSMVTAAGLRNVASYWSDSILAIPAGVRTNDPWASSKGPIGIGILAFFLAYEKKY